MEYSKGKAFEVFSGAFLCYNVSQDYFFLIGVCNALWEESLTMLAEAGCVELSGNVKNVIYSVKETG